jgi:hypothetical protein
MFFLGRRYKVEGIRSGSVGAVLPPLPAWVRLAGLFN